MNKYFEVRETYRHFDTMDNSDITWIGQFRKAMSKQHLLSVNEVKSQSERSYSTCHSKE
jgi:hypothetical protein